MRDRLKLNFQTLVAAALALAVTVPGFAQTASTPAPAAASAASPFITFGPASAASATRFGPAPRPKPAIRSGDYIVAVVNDESVTANEVTQRIAKVREEDAEKGGPQPTAAELRKQALDQLIEERVLVTYARDNGVKVDEGEVDRAIGNIASSNKMTVDQLRDRLRQQGIDYTTFRHGIRDQILTERIREREVVSHIRVTDAEINDYIAKQRGNKSSAPEIDLAQILIPVPDKATPDEVAQLEGARRCGVGAREERRAVRERRARDVRRHQQGKGRRHGLAPARPLPGPVREVGRRRQGRRRDAAGAQRRRLPHPEGAVAWRAGRNDDHADARAPHRAAAVGGDDARPGAGAHPRVPPADRQRREDVRGGRAPVFGRRQQRAGRRPGLGVARRLRARVRGGDGQAADRRVVRPGALALRRPPDPGARSSRVRDRTPSSCANRPRTLSRSRSSTRPTRNGSRTCARRPSSNTGNRRCDVCPRPLAALAPCARA